MLKEEWMLLQTQHERYEFGALAIKLSALVLTTTFFLSTLTGMVFLSLMLILWLTEGIWKTFQSRLAERLIIIEKCLEAGQESGAMQLHTEWENNRPDSSGLVIEYISNSLRPTIALPYVLLIIVAIIL